MREELILEQTEFWKGKFGDDYTERNHGEWDEFYKEQWGITRTELNVEFLGDLDKDIRILEAGCNRGNQLEMLNKNGFTNLWGIDVNKQALGYARSNKELNLVEGSLLDIPFKDNYFDLVFTSGVLIHIHPDDLKKAMSEIVRVSKGLVWGFEYFAEECTPIEYRGNANKLWKNDFLKLYLDTFPELKVVKKKLVPYLKDDNKNMMFLMKKCVH